jgi:hypothetical protein
VNDIIGDVKNPNKIPILSQYATDELQFVMPRIYEMITWTLTTSFINILHIFGPDPVITKTTTNNNYISEYMTNINTTTGDNTQEEAIGVTEVLFQHIPKLLDNHIWTHHEKILMNFKKAKYIKSRKWTEPIGPQNFVFLFPTASIATKTTTYVSLETYYERLLTGTAIVTDLTPFV